MAKEQIKKSGIWNLYQKSGNNVEKKNKSCPKCGAGTFMAKHTNRRYCGKCKYVEVVK
jgi:small subunit ribosomal protein S27Ae